MALNTFNTARVEKASIAAFAACWENPPGGIEDRIKNWQAYSF